MSTTHIDTNSIPRVNLNGQGEMAEILNNELCGAQNVVGSLRWLDQGDRFAAQAIEDTHQLLYLMEGEGVIHLENKNYEVKKGAGIYLGPSETATISHAGNVPLKLFHLVVPKKSDS
jgi:mannose-6-phosphate isomerase-like protein (cupin superfamily)